MRIKIENHTTAAEYFEDFILSKKAHGLAEKTLYSYQSHFHAAGLIIDWNKPIGDIRQRDIDQLVCHLRDKGLKSHTIATYIVTIKTFFSWARKEGLSTLNVPLYKVEESIKETYTDDELRLLLKKPNLRKCAFSEYRNWVIINMLLNSGCRAATLRNIKISDVDLEGGICYFRHTKNKKAQVSPLCSEMKQILQEYLRVRKGTEDDYLFPNEFNGQMNKSCLESAIHRYNLSRGVKKTSIHLFRHTFARKYLLDCGGNAFTLQKLLGHSTLEMTRKYCELFNADILREFDTHSPLSFMVKSTKKEKIKK